MKKILFIIVIGILLCGCSLDGMDGVYDAGYENRIQKSDIFYHEDFENLKSVGDINLFLKLNITYKKDVGGDRWEKAETTLKRGYGDCEDIAILFMNIYYVVFGKECSLVLVSQNRTIVEGGVVNHALVQYPDGRISDPLSGLCFLYDVGYSYSFSEFFN